jgi:GTP-binding protein Era
MSHRSGFVALVGRPNAGKSTLMNRLVGRKVAIVSNKPQTTRNRILGVVHRPEGQIVLVDAPGIHKPEHDMNRRMVDTALRALSHADVALWMVDASERYGPGERYVREALRSSGRPVILALNKIDLVEKPKLLPVIATYKDMLPFADVVPVSARTGENVDRLEKVLFQHLPEGEALYPEDYVTDQTERFIVAEMVREKILKRTREEIPYSVGVIIESFEEKPEMVRIEATVYVERDGQKAILIGRGGEMMKAVGTDARRDIEELLDTKVFLGLFVKVRPRWREDGRLLEAMGLEGRGGTRD